MKFTHKLFAFVLAAMLCVSMSGYEALAADSCKARYEADYDENIEAASEEDATSNQDASSASDSNAKPTTGIASDLPEAPWTSSVASIVIDAETGQVLYENNAHSVLYPASITKILTALVALENGDYNSTITMSENAVWGIEEGSSCIGLQVGEQISFESAMYAMMLESANEASWAIAEQVSGSLESFCDLMNKKAAELGCENTHFTNANGLHDDNHYTTAYDMALITREALKNPTFIKLTTDLEYTVPATNLNEARPLHQENRMRLEASDYYYPACLGGKTGYTDQAGGTLVTWAEKNGMKLICVDMFTPSNAENYIDSSALFDYCFDNFEVVYPFSDFNFTDEHKAQAKGCLDAFYNVSSEGDVELSADTDKRVLLPKNYSKDKLVKKLNFNATNADNNEIGRITLEYKDEECLSIPITYSNYSGKPDSSGIENESGNSGDTAVSSDATNQKSKKKLSKTAITAIILLLVAGAGIGLYLRVLYVRRQRELYQQQKEELRRRHRY